MKAKKTAALAAGQKIAEAKKALDAANAEAAKVGKVADALENLEAKKAELVSAQAAANEAAAKSELGQAHVADANRVLQGAKKAVDSAASGLKVAEEASAKAEKELAQARALEECAKPADPVAPVQPADPAKPSAPVVVDPAVTPPAVSEVVAQQPAPKQEKALAHTGATTDGALKLSLFALLGGVGIVAASRYTPRHRGN